MGVRWIDVMLGAHKVRASLPDNPIRDNAVRRDTHARRRAFLHIFGSKSELRIAVEHGDGTRSGFTRRGYIDIVRSSVIRTSEIIRSQLPCPLTFLIFVRFHQPTCYQHVFDVVLLRFRLEQIQQIAQFSIGEHDFTFDAHVWRVIVVVLQLRCGT